MVKVTVYIEEDPNQRATFRINTDDSLINIISQARTQLGVSNENEYTKLFRESTEQVTDVSLLNDDSILILTKDGGLQGMDSS